MGLGGNLAHFFIKTAITSLVMWIILVWFMEIPSSKIPMLLIVSFLANAVSSIVASLILFKQRGY